MQNRSSKCTPQTQVRIPAGTVIFALWGQFYPNFWQEICDVRVLTDSVGRTLALNSSAAGRPFHIKFCRQLIWPGFSLCVDFRGVLWGSDFWQWEGLESGTSWRRRNAEFTVAILTYFHSGVVQFSCAVAFCGCMETDEEEKFLVGDFFWAVKCRCYKLLFYSALTHSGLWDLTAGHLAHNKYTKRQKVCR